MKELEQDYNSLKHDLQKFSVGNKIRLTSSLVAFKDIISNKKNYLFVVIPIIIFIVLILWKPAVLVDTETEKISVKKFIITYIIILIIISIIPIIFFCKNKFFSH